MTAYCFSDLVTFMKCSLMMPRHASRELELTLTGKNCGMEERAPMCGVPFHSADTYIARLVEKGYKVAICEQTEDPAASHAVSSSVRSSRVVTPGTVLSSAHAQREREQLHRVGSSLVKTILSDFPTATFPPERYHLTLNIRRVA